MLNPQPGDACSKHVCMAAARKDSYIRHFHIRQGALDSVTRAQYPKVLLSEGLLTSLQTRRLWIGVGHHIHGIVMEFEDGTQLGEMLYDDGKLTQLPATRESLALRETARNFTNGEFVVKLRSVKINGASLPTPFSAPDSEQR